MTKPLEWRIKQLQGLRSFLIDEEDALCKAVYSDLRKVCTAYLCFAIAYANLLWLDF